LIKKYSATFVIALLFILGFEPFNLYLLPILGLCLLFFITLNESPKKAASLFFSFGFFLFGIGLYWLYISISVVSGGPFWLSIFLISLLAVSMAIYYALTGFLIVFSYKKYNSKVITLLFFAPSIWVVMEWFRGFLFSGFPWFTLGYSQTSTWLTGWAPIGGVYVLSFITALSSSLLLLIFLNIKPYRYLGIIFSIYLCSLFLESIEWTESKGDTLNVSLVQGGIVQEKKWLRSEFNNTLNLYKKSLMVSDSMDLVIWPEVAIPALSGRVKPYLEELNEIMLSKKIQLLIIGINTLDEERNVYNSLLTMGADNMIYNKRHLVPFGEYFPVPDFIKDWLQEMKLPNNDITKGDFIQRMPKLNDIFIATSICFEDIFASEQLIFQPEANVLVNITNNAWFGESIASEQHFQMSRMRALETGRFLLRTSNTGITAIVKPDGTIQEQLDPYEFSILQGSFQPMQGLTPYIKFGNYLIVILVIFMMSLGYYLVLSLKKKETNG
jgi:apolipoprotein N-acyltransferase